MQADFSKTRLDMEEDTPRPGKAKTTAKRGPCIKFYDSARPLCLEIAASGIGLWATLLQVKDGMNCGHNEIPNDAILQPTAVVSKSLSSVEWAREILPVFFMREVCTITDYKSLMAILSKDVATLPHDLQCILLWIHWYRVCIIYMPGQTYNFQTGHSTTTMKKTKIMK